MKEEAVDRFYFPAWTTSLLSIMLPVLGIGALYVGGVVWFGAVPKTTDVGYQPEQPIPFSHKLHAGTLKMDCRYCHSTVDKAAFAAIPPTTVCLNCHNAQKDPAGQMVSTAVHTESPKLAPLRSAADTGKPIDWVKVHDLPDYAFFNHSAHVTKGVSCVSCHGRIDKMEKVYQAKELSMSWCLDCHRNPAPNLRPVEFVTKLDWDAEQYLKDRAEDTGKNYSEAELAQAAEIVGKEVMESRNIHPNTNCSTCHR